MADLGLTSSHEVNLACIVDIRAHVCSANIILEDCSLLLGEAHLFDSSVSAATDYLGHS